MRDNRHILNTQFEGTQDCRIGHVCLPPRGSRGHVVPRRQAALAQIHRFHHGQNRRDAHTSSLDTFVVPRSAGA